MESLRDYAKFHRDKAEKELRSNDDSHLDYAALSLRKTIEYLAYDRLNAYHKEINLDIYDVWQPKKVIEHLCEIDPNATTERTISVAVTNESLPIEAQDYKVLGTEIPITINILKKPYQSLGSYLHAPTRKQIKEGKVRDLKKLRLLCEKILVEVDRILSSTIWGTAIGNFTYFDCLRCGEESIFRNIEDQEARKIWCSKCNAQYTALIDENSELKVKPHVKELSCFTENCDFVHKLWEDKFEYEKEFRCEECNGLFRYIYAVQPLIGDNKT